MQSGEWRKLQMSCDRCKRRDAFASQWDVHVSFALGQILCPQCYLRAGSWREAELTLREAERLRGGIRPSSGKPVHATEVEDDLVRGKRVQPGPGVPTVAFGPQWFFFCSDARRGRFTLMPVLYLRRAWSRKDADRFPPEQFVP